MSNCLTILKEKPLIYNDRYIEMIAEILTEVLPECLEKYEDEKKSTLETIKSLKKSIFYFKLLTGVMIGSSVLIYLFQKTVEKYHTV